MNKKEYEWVKQTRKELLALCHEIKSEDLTRQIEGFGKQSIQETLVHIAECYIAWLGSFILLQTKKPITPKEKLIQFSLEEIKQRFSQADLFVNEVFESYAEQMDVPINKSIPWRESSGVISMTPRKLLVHTITHEFHHKGQIVAMARQLGYVPPNTDVLGTED